MPQFFYTCAADITLTVSLLAERVETLQKRLTELPAGGITVKTLGEAYRPGPREDVK